MTILNHHEINQKITRLAYEILEEYIDEKELYLIGINNNGMNLQKALILELKKVSKKLKIHPQNIRLNPASPNTNEIQLDLPLKKLIDKNILIVDDVASTGRTLYYAAAHFNTIIPKSIKVAVLVDRKHKSFPIHVDFVGRSLATTLNNNILVYLDSQNERKAVLE